MKTFNLKQYIIPTLILSLILGIFSFIPVKSKTDSTEITLTWSTETYTPTDYKGKPLPTRGSQIEVVANIDRTETQVQDIVFKWFVNNKIEKKTAGKEGQVFIFDIGKSTTQTETVKLEIQNNNGESLSQPYFLTLKAHKPEVVIKPQTPPYEFSDQDFDYKTKTNQKISFIAKPYFFDIKTPEEIKYEWSLEGKPAKKQSEKKPYAFTLNTGEISEKLQKELNLRTVNKNNQAQMARSFAQILFEP